MTAAVGRAAGRARPATRPRSALTEPTGELATVPPASTTTYARRPSPQPATQPPPAPAGEGRTRQAGPAFGDRLRLGTSGPVNTGAGFVLGLVLWGWVVMPFIEGGPTQVRNVLRAKFLNKASDGSWLP